MRPKGSAVSKDSKTAKLLTVAINDSELSQANIADKLGYARPNMVTMIKQGHSRLPFDKLEKMAELVNLDPKHLLETALEEYEPDIFLMLKKHGYL